LMPNVAVPANPSGPFPLGMLSTPHQQWQTALSTLALLIRNYMPLMPNVAVPANPSGPFPLGMLSNPHQPWRTALFTLALMITRSTRSVFPHQPEAALRSPD